MDIDRLPEVFTPGPLATAVGPRGITARLSLEGLGVQTEHHWGGEIRLGFNEANLPFWTSGTFQLRAAAVALGARRVDIGQTGAESWTVLADPEGNEFCVVRPKETLVR